MMGCMESSRRKPKPHNHGFKTEHCEDAGNPGCRCKCRGALHQSHLLREALRGEDDELWREAPDKEPVTAARFETDLTNTFGSSLKSLEAPPPDDLISRPGRGKWKDLSNAPARLNRGKAGLREKRIVDVTLRDILSITFELPDSAKRRWLTVADHLTLRDEEAWSSFVAELSRLKLKADAHSGFFWSALLAALAQSQILPQPTKLHPFTTKADTENNISHHDAGTVEGPGDSRKIRTVAEVIVDAVQAGKPEVDASLPPNVFKFHCYPRVTGVKLISETGNSEAVDAAADRIGQAAVIAVRYELTQEEFMLIVGIVGLACSADLWEHPAAVRYLLIPTVTSLRRYADRFGVPASFGLDDQPAREDPPKNKSKKKKPPAAAEMTTGSAPAQRRKVEQVIDEELGTPWRLKRHWGQRDEPPNKTGAQP